MLLQSPSNGCRVAEGVLQACALPQGSDRSEDDFDELEPHEELTQGEGGEEGSEGGSAGESAEACGEQSDSDGAAGEMDAPALQHGVAAADSEDDDMQASE